MKPTYALAGALALACFATPARAESALEFAAAEASRSHAAQIITPVRPPARHRRFALSIMIAETRESRLLEVAERYIGSHRFTPFRRPWCADAIGAWLHQAGYSSTGDGRAISYAHYGRATTPHIGAIAVMPHHVGVVVGFSKDRGPILVSGNHRHRVGVGVYSAHRIIAYREPV